MPITRKGPGNPGKVASKMTKTTTGKLKNVFTNISAKMKAEQAGRDQVKKYKESLKQQKLAEQKAQKDLQLKERGGKRGKMSVSKEVKVKAKSPGYGYFPVSEEFGENKKQSAGLFKSQVKKTKLPSDSAGYFNTLKSLNLTEGKSTQADMSRHQLMVKKLFPNATFTYGKRGGNTNLGVKFNTPLNQMTAKQKAYYEKHRNIIKQ